MNELERWANFYLLMSAAAATLLGLMFVVIALAADRRSGDTAKIHIYLTPTVIYFASVLYLAALLTFPNHTRLTASLCTCLGGFAGLVYSGSFFLIARGGEKNYYGLQDWIVYVVVPFAAYGVQVFGGACSSAPPNADSPWWLPVCCRCLRLAFATRGPSPSTSSLPFVGSKIRSSPLPSFQGEVAAISLSVFPGIGCCRRHTAQVIRPHLQGVRS
jgi:hypothetical protein